MLRCLLFLFTIFILRSCAPTYKAHIPEYYYDPLSEIPNYSQFYYWAAHPWKKDLSDSVPKRLMNKKQDSLADVFFIHPTTYTGKKAEWNADIHNATLNATTDYSTILFQSSVFNQHCRVFAPRYRQAHLSAFFKEDSTTLAVFDTAYTDVKNAFEYYLKNENKGRPIIIAGHSQGAKMGERLLKEFFDGKALQKQLVAAYIIGWPLPQDYFQYLQACKTAEETGCVCSWRTYRKGYLPGYVRREDPPSFVTNPLNWKNDESYAGKELHKGSVLRNFNKIIKHPNDAQIHQGILWVRRPRFPGSLLYTSRNYHIGDINLFYINTRENVGLRIKEFLKKQ